MAPTFVDSERTWRMQLMAYMSRILLERWDTARSVTPLPGFRLSHCVSLSWYSKLTMFSMSSALAPFALFAAIAVTPARLALAQTVQLGNTTVTGTMFPELSVEFFGGEPLLHASSTRSRNT